MSDLSIVAWIAKDDFEGMLEDGRLRWVRRKVYWDDDIGPITRHSGQPGGSIGRRRDDVVAGRQVDAQRAQNGRLVVDDQDACHGTSEVALLTGSSIRMVRPPSMVR